MIYNFRLQSHQTLQQRLCGRVDAQVGVVVKCRGKKIGAINVLAQVLHMATMRRKPVNEHHEWVRDVVALQPPAALDSRQLCADANYVSLLTH